MDFPQSGNVKALSLLQLGSPESPDHLEALVMAVARPSGSHGSHGSPASPASCESFVSSFRQSFAWNRRPWNSYVRWTRCWYHLRKKNESEK